MDKKEVQTILEEAMEKGRKAIPNGAVASYIPELSKADKNHLGLCICTRDGRKYSVGDTNIRFTIQSISKIISLAVALEIYGFNEVFKKVDMEPSGEAFNSLIDLDLSSNKPLNPMINSGALTVCSLLLPKVTFSEMKIFAKKLCLDSDMDLDKAVYNSEKANLSRNRAIAYLLESKGIIENDVEDTLELYIKMCSLTVTAESLANLGLILANDGIDPNTDTRLLKTETVHTIKTIMLTCGMYDSSGEFAVYVGVPTKSGVGGGLVSTVDKEMGIGVYSPSLDEKGNCIAGRPLLEHLSKKLKLHIFDRNSKMDIE